MINLAEFLTQPDWQPLLRALLHTLWIGAVSTILLFTALRTIAVRRSNMGMTGRWNSWRTPQANAPRFSSPVACVPGTISR